MCLALPARVISVERARAHVELRGKSVEIDASLVPVEAGDFVLVYAGLIVEKLEREDAEERLRLIAAADAGAVA